MPTISQSLQDISSSSLEAHIRNLQGVRHPGQAPQALERAADYIRDHLASNGYEVSAHFFTEDGHEYRNIIATRQGITQPHKRVILLAHYDTVPDSPGANDNASGVAGLLEIARVLAGLRFEKTVQFVGVNLEERKDADDKNSPFLRGSRALAAHARQEGWEIEGVIDLEEIAFAGDTAVQTKPENLPLDLPAQGNFIGVVGNQNSAGMVRGYMQAIEQHHLPLPCVPMVVPGSGEMFPDIRRSDHAAFWDAGYPAIMITDTANFRTPHYHQPTDVLETLNLAFAAEVCRATAGLVFSMAGHVE